MEWVETTGRTIEEAKDAALDQLGVDEQDAEFNVVEEARSGLFGRLRQEARVRARVRPDRPRPKVDRRDRRRRGSGGSDRSSVGADQGSTDVEATPEPESAAPRASRTPPVPAGDGADRTRARPRPARAAKGADSGPRDGDEGPSQQEQADAAKAFLEGLADAFGAQGRAEVELVDEGMIEARLTGEDLGLLIGPKGQTLAAVQELARAAVQQGPHRGSRLRVDVGGYQERRRAALERFAREVAEKVRSTGVATSLEPMPSPDRKVVHDAVTTVEGVQSRSEGEDPQRRVLIVPEEPAG